MDWKELAVGAAAILIGLWIVRATNLDATVDSTLTSIGLAA